MIQEHHVRQNIYWAHCVELLDCNDCEDKTKCMIQHHCVRQNIYWTDRVLIVQSYQIVMVVKIKLNV